MCVDKTAPVFKWHSMNFVPAHFSVLLQIAVGKSFTFLRRGIFPVNSDKGENEVCFN